jgi:aspartyl-tRNA(Asn)/glutamyl-tRNA(Gln) amidotransferase subunit B
MASLCLGCTTEKELVFEKELCPISGSAKGFRYIQHSRPIGKNGRMSFNHGKEEKSIDIAYAAIAEEFNYPTKYRYNGLYDNNLSGAPLVIISSQPSLSSAAEAGDYIRALFTMLSYFGVSNVIPQEEPIYAEITLFTDYKGKHSASTVTHAHAPIESLKSIIEFEEGRQQGLLSFGLPVEPESFYWDEKRQSAAPQEEEAEKKLYSRAFSLPVIDIHDDYLELAASAAYELPEKRKQRYMQSYHLAEGEAEIICRQRAFVELFEEASRLSGFEHETAVWIAHELYPLLKDWDMQPGELKLSPQKLAGLVILQSNFMINQEIGRKILKEMIRNGVDPYEYAVSHSLALVIDHTTLSMACRLALRKNLVLFEEYLQGDKIAFEKLADSAMEELSNKADRKAVELILEEEAKPKAYDLVSLYPLTNVSPFDLKAQLDVNRLMEMTRKGISENTHTEGSLPLRAYGKDLTDREISTFVDSIVEKTIHEAGTSTFVPKGVGKQIHYEGDIDALVTELVGTAPGDPADSEIYARYYEEKQRLHQEHMAQIPEQRLPEPESEEWQQEPLLPAPLPPLPPRPLVQVAPPLPPKPQRKLSEAEELLRLLEEMG